MQTIVGFDSLGQEPVQLQNVASVVVVDDFGNPVWAIQRLSTGAIFISSAKDAKFHDFLKSIGVGLRAPQVKVIPNEPKSL